MRARASAALCGLCFMAMAALALAQDRLVWRGMREQAMQRQQQRAEEMSRRVATSLDEIIRDLAAATDFIPFDHLSIAGTAAVLRIPLRQLPQLNAILLLNTDGTLRGPPVVRNGRPGERSARPSLDVDLLLHHAPVMEEVLARGAAVGVPYVKSDREPAISVAVRVPTKKPRMLVAEVSLGWLLAQSEGLAGGDLQLALLSGAGDVIAGSVPTFAIDSELAKDLRGARIARRTITRDDGRSLLTSAQVPGLDWTVLAEERVQTAFAAGIDLRHSMMCWALVLGLGAALLASLAVRWIARPLEQWKRDLLRRVERRTEALRTSQEQVLRSRRLTALTSLCAGLLHELNNPLTGVLGLLTLLEQNATRREDAAMMQDARDEVRRVEYVLARFKHFVEQETADTRELIEVASLLRHTVDACQGAARERGVRLQIVHTDDLPKLQADFEATLRAMRELVNNAIEASTADGRVSVEAEVLAGDVVRMTVRDHGSGFSARDVDRSFDPFFTTRASRDHTGMGLSIAHAAIQAQHGKLVIRPGEPAGTRVEVFMPAAPRPAHIE